MDPQTLHNKFKALKISEALVDPNLTMGMMVMNKSIAILRDDGSPEYMVFDMDTLNFLNEGFSLMYNREGKQMLESPEGHEAVFEKIGNFILDEMPCLFGLEEAQEILKSRGKL